MQQIALARSSNYLFSIFPARPGTKICRIPKGGPRGVKPLRGTCTTSIHAGATHEPTLVVTFTEKWRFPPCSLRDDCVAVRIFRHTWRVMVTADARPRVLATQQSGATAPQYYR